MKLKLKDMIKRTFILFLCVISFGSAVLSSISYAKASAYEQLGTSAALGSPVLNSNFTIENWNKWEMVAWGVYLSNFCVPLIDTYSSAFQAGKDGSKGAGYKALCFGSGSDSENNKTIQELCSYAIAQQANGGHQLYVTYSAVDDTGVVASIDPNNCDGTDYIRAAQFKDLFMQHRSEIDSSDKNDFTNSLDAVEINSSTNLFLSRSSYDILKNNVTNLRSAYAMFDDTSYFHTIEKAVGFFPTFWIKSDSKYVKVFDYTDSWDIQIAANIISRAVNSDTEEAFYNAFNEAWDNNVMLKTDCFSNIVTNDNKMIIPASANQHITTDKRINLLNSFVLNGNTSSISKDKLLNGAQQYLDTVGLGISTTGTGANAGALPALSGKDSVLENGSTYLYYDIDNVAIANKGSDFGVILKELFDNSDTTSKTHKYNLKLETVNKLSNGIFGHLSKGYSGNHGKALGYNQIAASLISTQLNQSTQSQILTDITLSDGSKLNLFKSDPILVPVVIKAKGKADSEESNTRKLWNFIYQTYTGKINTTEGNKFNQSSLNEAIKSNSSNVSEFAKALSDLEAWRAYASTDSNVSKKFNMQKIIDVGANNSFSDAGARVIVLYPTSDVMQSVSNVLGVVDGTEFSVYSTYIYMSYLDYYGITKTSSLTSSSVATSNFDPEIFPESSDILNIDPSDIIDVKSDEEIENEIKRYAYLMLNPTAGRSYRSEILNNSVSDWIYEHYRRTVYGTSTKETSISSKSNSGFLNIDTYYDNPLTAPVLSAYSRIAVVLIMVFLILMLVVGLINNKKMTWFIFTAFTVVNVIMIMPSVGEIVPYVTSNMVQNMFSSKMTYWSVSEAVENATVEADAVDNGMEGLSTDEAKQVTSLIKQLNVLYLDRSLMIKRDISAKTIQKVNGSYTEIQQLQSARWLLPMIMRQYSDENSKNDYVYVPVGDLYDDMSNLYWYYNPADADKTTIVSPTLTSPQSVAAGTATECNDIDAYYKERKSIYQDYIDTFDADSNSDISYQSYAYTKQTDAKDLYHTYNYLLRNTTIGSRQSYFSNAKYKSNSDFYKFTNSLNIPATQTGFKNKSTDIQKIADQYNRADRSTMNEAYGYLWATQDQAHFFYENIKQSVDSDVNLGSLIGQLQGEYEKDKNGVEVRDNFMYATESSTGTDLPTGFVRDINDLQSMFTNMIPYLYEVQLVTGGEDGNGGVLTETDSNGMTTPLKITDNYSIYEGSNQSWLFRCNWAVKLMECPEYNKAMSVYDSEGNRYKVEHPMLAEYYPSNRPMVFSEAQMYAQGLTEADLNIVELKCVKVNKETSKKWTLLVNYAGTSGITLEILERQMALDAMLIFNEVFNPDGITGTSYKMYPSSLDLRNISFDSIMKMLMLNTSKDTSYIYGDTMKTLLENADIVTALFLLIIAYLCAYIIPFIRTLLMAVLFYLGFISILNAIFSDNKYKSKVACGQLICNILFLAMTIAFYGVFALMLNVTSSDEVLSLNTMRVTPGNPVWTLIIVAIACVLYANGLAWEIMFCWVHRKDLGFEVFSTMGSMAVSKIRSSIDGIKSDLAFRKGEDKQTTSTSNSSHSDASDKSDDAVPVKVESNEDDISTSAKHGRKRNNNNDSTSSSSSDSSSYNDKQSSDDGNTDALMRDINKIIDEGAKKAKEEEKSKKDDTVRAEIKQ